MVTFPRTWLRGRRRLGWFLIVFGALLMPWLGWLAWTLPRHYSAHHYWLSWAGFDLALGVLLIRAGLHALRSDPRLNRTAAATAALLLVDSWFDLLNAADQADRLTALALALLVEVPLAAVLWQLTKVPPAEVAADGGTS